MAKHPPLPPAPPRPLPPAFKAGDSSLARSPHTAREAVAVRRDHNNAAIKRFQHAPSGPDDMAGWVKSSTRMAPGTKGDIHLKGKK